ncbi:Mediator of DNA damage checkpoint protein 1 [Holothuria leucospilota]|uniref:Mediator of DNA damage checkpoint protein 1 n=1 Tax=Holothuria leucospilota TaxID=206669 RepID=A0A9Q1BUU8_HOLLE|nr:Mediator of DNA damage checkpoint protein 1 [Holothuria leucospilota]
MDIDATQAIDLSDFDEDDEKTDELERSPVGYLKVLSNRGFQETTFPVYEGENFIGRDATNSIAVPVKSLSKQHACIEVQADSHLLYDMGSRNKTRKAKLFLKPNVRYNIQHNDKIMLADMSCQYFFASEYEKSQKENDSGSDTDSELMLDGVDSDPALLLPQLEDLKESENSDSPNLSDCIQPTQAVSSDSRSHENETLQMKTPAAPKVGGVLAAESDDETPAKNGAADVSRVQESGSDTDVEACANETEDFSIEGDDLAMAATQACNIQDPPTQPNKNAKATLHYDPDSDAESDDDTTRGRSLYEAETQAAPGVVSGSEEDDGDEEAVSKNLYEAETQVAQEDDDDDDNARGRSLYEAETQVAQGGGSENDSDDGDDEVRGRSLYEAETQAVPGGISGSDDDDDNDDEGEAAMRGASLYEAATQALNFEDSDDEEKSTKKRVSIASTVQLNVSSDLESSGKKPRQSMSPTKTSLMRATKNRVTNISDELRENADVTETAPLELKDIKINQTDSEDTEIEKSEDIKNTPFKQLEESTEETLPCEELDLEGPTQEMIDLEEQKKNPRQEQNEPIIKDHSIPVNENHSKKSTDAGFGSEKEDKDVLAVESGETSSRGNTDGSGNKVEGKVASEKMGNVGGRSVVESTLHYELHRSQSDASKDSQESISSKSVDAVAAPTVPYQLVKSLTESSSGSRQDTMETLLHPIESEEVEMSHEGDGEGESTEETQAYGEDDAEPLGEVEEGADKETTKGKVDEGEMDVDATQQYGEENEEMVLSTGDVGKTDQEIAMETDATQAYGAEDDGDGVSETQVYGEDGGEDGGNTQVPDSQEDEQTESKKEGDIQKDNVFAEEGVVAVDGGKLETTVEIDAAPQRRKSGDEGILKKRKGSIPSTSNDEKVGLLSTLKKKVRFGRGNSASQSGVSIHSSRSSSRSSQSSVGSKDEEFEIITHDEGGEEDEVVSSEDLSSVSEEKPVRERRSSRKRKVGTIEKPDEEEVKKMKAVVDEENEREKDEIDSAYTEKDGGRGGRKSARKRKTATIEKPDLSRLSSPELESKDKDGVTQVDSSVRRSRRKDTSKSNEEEQEVEKDGNNNNTTKKRSGRSKVTATEDKLITDIPESEEVKGSLRQRKGKQPVARDEVSSARSTRRLQGQQAEASGNLVDNFRDNEKGNAEKKDVGTSLKVTSLDDSLSVPAKNSTRSLRGKAKKGEVTSTDDKKKSIPNEREGREQVKVEQQVSSRETRRGRGKEKETGDIKEKMSVDKEEGQVPRISRRGKRGGPIEADVPARKVSKQEAPLEQEIKSKEHEVSKAEAEDTPQKGGRRGRNKKQEAVTTTPSSSRTRTRGRNQVRADTSGGVKASVRGDLQKDQGKDEADDTSESSSTMSLGSQSLPDADSDASFVHPEPVKGRRGGRRKKPVVKVEDSTSAASEIGGNVQEEDSTPRRGRGQGGRSTPVNTPEKTTSSAHNSRSSKTPSQGTLSKSPRNSPTQLDPGSSPSLRRRSSELKPKVMFTGVIDKSGEKVVTALGGELVDSVFHCTHLVTDKVRRTVKFLCCLSRGALIVTPDWLEQSKIQQRFIDAKDFMLCDKDAERQHKFSLSKSIEIANKGALLSGWKVHTTPNVKPEPSQMKDIIKSAGGEILSRVPCQHQDCTVVISCEADSSKCLPAVAADIPIVTAEFLLTGLLRQKIDLEEYPFQVLLFVF